MPQTPHTDTPTQSMKKPFGLFPPMPALPKWMQSELPALLQSLSVPSHSSPFLFPISLVGILSLYAISVNLFLPVVTVHARVPSNGICRGFAFKYGKFLLPPRFLTALSVPKVPTVTIFSFAGQEVHTKLQQLCCHVTFHSTSSSISSTRQICGKFTAISPPIFSSPG